MMAKQGIDLQYKRMSLRVILLLHSFRRTVVFDFSLGSCPVWSQVLGHPTALGLGFSFWNGLKSNQIRVDYSKKLCATITFCRIVFIIDQRVGVNGCFSPTHLNKNTQRLIIITKVLLMNQAYY